MKKNFKIFCFFFFLFYGSNCVFGQTTLFSDNFDSYGNTDPLPTTGTGWKCDNLEVGHIASSWYWEIWAACTPPSAPNCLTVEDGVVDCDYVWNNDGSKIAFYGTLINATGYNSLKLNFKWKCYGEANLDYGTAVWSTDGVNWNNVSATKYQTTSGWTTESNLDLSAANGLSFYIGFRFQNNASLGTAPGFSIDDVSITGVNASITTSAISGSPFCAGGAVNVPFTSTGTYSGNTYTAQLSNSAGSFASPTNIGTLVSNANSGTISATIPGGTGAGSGYRIRVVSSNPAVTGTDNGTNLTVTANASITSVTGTTPLCMGGTATYSANGVVLGGGTGVWSSSNTSVATVNASGVVAGVAAGTCNIIYTITGGCGGTVSAQQAVTINPNASITSVTGSSPLCINGTATYSANGVVLSGGTGAWSSSNTSVATVNGSALVTGIAAGTCNIIYTITGGCGGTVSAQQAVTIVAATTPYAGPDQYVCTGGTVTMAATTLPGTWTVVSGAGTFSPNANAANATVTGLSVGANVYRWTATCSGTYDDVVVIQQ